jgi:hypothetical protein
MLVWFEMCHLRVVNVSDGKFLVPVSVKINDDTVYIEAAELIYFVFDTSHFSTYKIISFVITFDVNNNQEV